MDVISMFYVSILPTPRQAACTYAMDGWSILKSFSDLQTKSLLCLFLLRVFYILLQFPTPNEDSNLGHLQNNNLSGSLLWEDQFVIRTVWWMGEWCHLKYAPCNATTTKKTLKKICFVHWLLASECLTIMKTLTNHNNFNIPWVSLLSCGMILRRRTFS